MKRFLTLLLALSLCILVGCKEEIPEKPIEEISVEEIPVEKEDESTEETPTEKADEPIEEVPAEPEIEESTEEIGEDVIMLPEANENTKIITIEFPDDFPEEPYKEPEFVSPEEFEWGGFYPVVYYAIEEPIEWFDPLVVDYSIITPDIKEIEEGTELYNNIVDNISITDSSKQKSSFESVLLESQIQNLQKVTKHDGFEVFEEAILQGREYSSQNVYIIDDSNGDLLYKVELPYSVRDNFVIQSDVLDFVAGKYLFFGITKNDTSQLFDFCTYSLNVETKELKLIGNYISPYFSTVSPDGKYILYHRPLGDGDSYTTWNNLKEMKNGFYFTNLENYTTCFFEYNYTKHGFSELPWSFHNNEFYPFSYYGWTNIK